MYVRPIDFMKSFRQTTKTDEIINSLKLAVAVVNVFYDLGQTLFNKYKFYDPFNITCFCGL